MRLTKVLSVITAVALVFTNITVPVSAQEMETMASSEPVDELEHESMLRLEGTEESAEIGETSKTENNTSEEQIESKHENESEADLEIRSDSQEAGSESEAVTETKNDLLETDGESEAVTETKSGLLETESGSETENEETAIKTESVSQEETETFLSGTEEEITEIIEEMIQEENEGEILVEGDFQYEVGSNGEVTITKYTGSETSIVVPEEIDGKKVTSIASRAFYKCSISNIKLPEGLINIGELAFYDCSSLTEITIPEGVTSIEKGAFKYCEKLAEITLPEGLTSIGEMAFSECSSLTEITLPEGLTSIESGVFDGCSSLTHITLPEGLTSIGNEAFCRCSSLTEITLPEGLTKIGWGAFLNCSSLTEITIPEGVTSIEKGAFKYCEKLTKITIPEGVTSIGASTFYDCSSLTEITLPEGVTSIGDSAFRKCNSLKSIGIPRGVTDIKADTFRNCAALSNVTIPKSVKSIGKNAFIDCGKRIDVYYEGTQEEWKQIKQPNSLDNNTGDLSGLKYNYGYYDSDNDTEVSYEQPYYVYIHCNSVISDDNREESFITIASDKQSYTKNYGDAAFQLEGISKTGDGTLVYTVTSGKDVVEVSSSGMVTIKNAGTAVITVSMAATDTYKEAESKTITITVNKEGTQIETDYRYRVESNGEITITAYIGKESDIVVPSEIAGKKVTKIGESAFDSEENEESKGAYLRNVILPEGIYSIGDAAFSNCKRLQNITLPDSITNIGQSAFACCYRLESIKIPRGVTRIQDNTFEGCIKLKNAKIPKSVKEIGSSAFVQNEDEGLYTFDIYYEGSKEEWSQIKKDEDWFFMIDEELIDIIIHYNYSFSDNDLLDAVITVASDKQSYTKNYGDAAFQLEGISKTGDGTLVYTVTSGKDVVEVSSSGMVTIKNAGTAVITVSMAATDTYKEAESKTITIIVLEEKEENPDTEETSNIFSVSEIAPQQYTGKAVKPDVKVTHNGRRLVLSQDYTLVYKNNTKAGTASVTIKGRGNYTESQTVAFSIERKDLSSSGIVIDDLALAYNGKVQKKAPAVTYNGKKLKAGTDYVVSYEDEGYKDKGTYTVSIIGKGNFKGEASGKVVILDKSMIINNAKVLLSQKKYDYTGKAVKPSVTVNLKGAALTAGEDYTVSYADNIQPGKAVIVIKGTGHYAGTKKVPFTINKQVVKLTEDMVSLPLSVAYEKGGCTPEPVITADGNILIKGTDYTVSYKNNKKAGTASLVVKGKGIYKGTVTKRFMIAPKEISKTFMRAPDVVYTVRTKAGKYISKPILTDTNGNILGSSDYMNVVYECGNQILDQRSKPDIGSVIKVTVTGKGNYTGTASTEYMLKDANAMIKTKVSVSPKTYTGGKVTLKPADLKVITKGRNLVYGKDYEIIVSSYKNNYKKGTAQVTLRGKGDFAGEKTIKFQITARKIHVE